MTDGHPHSDLEEGAAELARGLVAYACDRGWQPTCGDILDLIWLLARRGAAELFADAPDVSPPPGPQPSEKTDRPSNADSEEPFREPPCPDSVRRTPPVNQMLDVQPFVKGQRPSNSEGRLVRLSAPKAFPDERKFLQSLRAILRRGPSRNRLELDVNATVAKIAGEAVWEVVTRPVKERQLQLGLVLDVTSSMDMWRSFLEELSSILRACGAFRRVDVAYLVDGEGPVRLLQRLARDGEAPRQAKLTPLSTHDPMLYLVVSDSVSNQWRNPEWIAQLDHWAQSGTVAFFQVLPEFMWERTSLGAAEKRWSANFEWMATNASYLQESSAWEDFLDLSEDEDLAPPAASTASFPVATILSPNRVRHMANFLAGQSGQPTACYRLRGNDSLAAAAEQPPLKALQVFRLRATPQARRLATLLAASPAISLPLTRILYQTPLLQDGGPAVEAEVWLAGLLYPLEESASDDPEQILYDFREGIRDELLGGVPQQLSRRILEETSRFIEHNLGRLKGFSAWLSDPENSQGKLTAGAGSDPIARIAADLLRRHGDLAQIVDEHAAESGKRAQVPLAIEPRTIWSSSEIVKGFAWSPDGTRLAIPTRAGNLHVLDMSSNETVVRNISHHGVNRACWSLDGSTITVSNYSRTAKTIRANSLEHLRVFTGHNSDVMCVAGSPDGHWMATGTAGGTLRVWGLQDEQPRFLAHRHWNGVRSLCWLSPDSLLVGYPSRALLYRFDQPPREIPHGGHSLAVIDQPQSLWLMGVKVVAMGQANGDVRLVDAEHLEDVANITPHNCAVLSMSVSDDGRLLASKGRDGSVAIISTQNGDIVGTLQMTPTQSPHSALAFRPGTHELAISTSDDQEVQIYDLAPLADGFPPSPPVDELAFPASAVCRLRIERGGLYFQATAALIGPRRVLTTSEILRNPLDVASEVWVELADGRSVGVSNIEMVRPATTSLLPPLAVLTLREAHEADSPPLNVGTYMPDELNGLEVELLGFREGRAHPQSLTDKLTSIRGVLHREQLQSSSISEEAWSVQMMPETEASLLSELSGAPILANVRDQIQIVGWYSQGQVVSIAPAMAEQITGMTVEESDSNRDEATLRPSKWICVTGSGTHKLRPEELTAASFVGRTLADLSLGLITGGYPGVDYVVSDAFYRRLSELEVANPDAFLRQFVEPGKREFPHGEIQEIAKGRYFFEPLLEHADAVVVVGGLGGAGAVGRQALKRKIPVIPIGSTGGNASTLHQEILDDWAKLKPFSIPRRHFEQLGLPLEQSAAAVQALISRLRYDFPFLQVTSKTLQIEQEMPIIDPDIHKGQWVSTVENRVLKPSPRFCLGCHLVTNDEYFEFVQDRGYFQKEFWAVPRGTFRTQDNRTMGPGSWEAAHQVPTERGHHPVSDISYCEAEAFTRWLNAYAPVAGWQWSLPTEDMWEFAARLRHRSDPSPYPWGDAVEDFSTRCNSVEARLGGTSEVGRFSSGNSPDGCTDMAGNVWEFVERQEETCFLRGGSYRNNRHEIFCGLRLRGVSPLQRAPDFGFRVALIETDGADMASGAVSTKRPDRPFGSFFRKQSK